MTSNVNFRTGKVAEDIEVFQDMALHGPKSKRAELRTALIAAAVDPWRVDLQRSSEVAHSLGVTEDVILFRRDPTGHHPGAGLTLWATDDGYYVPNIVPLESGQLTFAQYNAILDDFVENIADPVASGVGFTVSKTRPRQAISDWVSSDATLKLGRFSGAANKSTGASHPSDERRWFDFIVAVHRSGDRLDASRLARWLHELEKWDEESAHDLAGDYEKLWRFLPTMMSTDRVDGCASNRSRKCSSPLL